MQRRDILRASGAGGLAALAGCLDSVPTVGETTLGLFGVYNFHQGSSHSFSVRIERDTTTVHTSSHRLAAYDPYSDAPTPPRAIVDCTWDHVPGDYTVFVRCDGGDWHEYRIVDTALRPPDCVIVSATYGELHDTGPDEPTLTFALDETNCAEVRTLPGGCPDAVPTETT